MSGAGVVIVGGGQTAAVAARTLRRRKYDGPITILGEEADRPYQRPPLSKEYLTTGSEDGLYLLSEEWTDSKDVEVRTGTRVTHVEPDGAGVRLEDGTLVPAEKVLLATGGTPRRMPGAEGHRVRYLRTRADSEALRSELRPGVRLLVVGAGFIGAEVASSARELGAEVTVLEAAAAPLLGLLGPVLGQAYARRFAGAGIDLHCGVTVDSIHDKGEEVVVTTDAGQHVADLVVVGIGITPNVEVAQASGIAVDNGVLVDEYCRTSMPNVFAAGDVANHQHPLFGTRMRVEHFENANRQGAAAANNMIGRETVYDDPHWFWSDQLGANLQYVGHGTGHDEVVVRGQLEDPEWSAFFLRDGLVQAAFAIDRPEDVMVAKEIIAARMPVSLDLLADTSNDLIEMLEQG